MCKSATLKTDTYWMQKIQERREWDKILYTILFYKNICLQALRCLQLKNISSKSAPICLTSCLICWKYSPQDKTFHGKILRNGHLWLCSCCRNHHESRVPEKFSPSQAGKSYLSLARSGEPWKSVDRIHSQEISICTEKWTGKNYGQDTKRGPKYINI